MRFCIFVKGGIAVMSISVLKTDFYDEFECVADKCNYTCCQGWSVYVDELHYNYYKSLGVANLNTNLKKTKEKYWKFIMDEKGYCPYFSENGLCGLILKYGSDVLCKTCQLFPRSHKLNGEYLEMTVSNACPAVVSMFEKRDVPITFVTDVTDEIVIDEKKVDDDLVCLRNEIIDILQTRDLPMWARLYMGYNIAYKVRKKESVDAIKEQFMSGDYIVGLYSQLISLETNVDVKMKMLYGFLQTLYNEESKDVHEERYHKLFKYVEKVDIELLKTEWDEFQKECTSHSILMEHISVNYAFDHIICSDRKRFQYSVFLLLMEYSLILFIWFIHWLTNDKTFKDNEFNEIICYCARKLDHMDESGILPYVRQFEKDGWLENGYIYILLK